MAGAFDRETLSFSTADEQAKAAGSRAAAVSGKEQAKTQTDYTKTLAKTKSTIDADIANAKKTLDLAKKKGTADQKAAAKDFYDTLVGLKPMLDKLGTEASNVYKGDKSILEGDTAFKAQGRTGVSSTGKYYVDGKEVSAQEYKANAGGTDMTGGMDEDTPLSPTSGATPAQVQADAERRDAFALLKDIFAQYGLEDLASTIEGYMKDDIGVNQATLLLKQTPAYQTRFAGNQMRLKAGLNVLSEAEYLSLENSYSETLKAYGQAGYFGVDRATRQAKLAAAIGADISAVEFKDRISTVVDRVDNADPAVKTTLRSFYGITDEDLVGYFLNPKENLPRLKEKVTSAEIGTSALAQGLTSNIASAEELAKYGVDLETARKGYATIADILPTVSKLGEIYKEEGINYNQGTAEQEVFKGLASAQRKRTRLAEKEIAAFGGSSGNSLGAGALSTQYLRKNSSAGQF